MTLDRQPSNTEPQEWWLLCQRVDCGERATTQRTIPNEEMQALVVGLCDPHASDYDECLIGSIDFDQVNEWLS